MAYYAYDSTANFLSLGLAVLICISKEQRCKEELYTYIRVCVRVCSSIHRPLLPPSLSPSVPSSLPPSLPLSLPPSPPPSLYLSIPLFATDLTHCISIDLQQLYVYIYVVLET